MAIWGVVCQEQAWLERGAAERQGGAMTESKDAKGKDAKGKDERAKRLAEELRKNLRKRKGQPSDRKRKTDTPGAG